MVDFIIDADPYIPTGVPATTEQVVQLVVDGVLPAEQVKSLIVDQQPEDLKAAVIDEIAIRVQDPTTTDVVEDYSSVLEAVGAELSVDSIKSVGLTENNLGIKNDL